MIPDPSLQPTWQQPYSNWRRWGTHNPGLGEARNRGYMGGGGLRKGAEEGPTRLTIGEWVHVLLGAAT